MPADPDTRSVAPVAAAEYEPNTVMLRQLYSHLGVLLSLGAAQAREEGREAVVEEAAGIVQPVLAAGAGPQAMSWREAYRAEQLLTAILPASSVRAELRRRLVEAEGLGIDAVADYAVEAKDLLEARPLDLEASRALLLRLVDDVQWKKTQRIELRTLSRRYRQRLNWFFAGTLAAFLGVLFALPNLLPEHLGFLIGEEGYSGLFAALSAGFLGASVSVLQKSDRTRSASIEDMVSMSARSQICLRLLVGGGGAAILYFLFETDLISGAAFPDLQQIAFLPIGFGASVGADPGLAPVAFGGRVPNADTCLLMIWSFVAGFSESFVPRMLARVEAGAGGAEAKKTTAELPRPAGADKP